MHPTLPGHPSALSRNAFIRALEHCVTGVAIIATDGPAGKFGAIVSAMNSVSAEPPLLMICIPHHENIFHVVDNNKYFSVNVLAEDQKEVAKMFAGQIKTDDCFAQAHWANGYHGIPLLSRALASFICQLHNQFELGNHTVLAGEVLDVKTRPVLPLAYQAQQYVLVQRDAH